MRDGYPRGIRQRGESELEYTLLTLCADHLIGGEEGNVGAASERNGGTETPGGYRTAKGGVTTTSEIQLRRTRDGSKPPGECEPVVRWDKPSHGYDASQNPGNHPGEEEESFLSGNPPGARIGAISAHGAT